MLGKGNPELLQELDSGIHKISQQHGENQRDDYARGVINENKNDRGGKNPQAEVR